MVRPAIAALALLLNPFSHCFASSPTYYTFERCNRPAVSVASAMKCDAVKKYFHKTSLNVIADPDKLDFLVGSLPVPEEKIAIVLVSRPEQTSAPTWLLLVLEKFASTDWHMVLSTKTTGVVFKTPYWDHDASGGAQRLCVQSEDAARLFGWKKGAFREISASSEPCASDITARDAIRTNQR